MSDARTFIQFTAENRALALALKTTLNVAMTEVLAQASIIVTDSVELATRFLKETGAQIIIAYIYEDAETMLARVLAEQHADRVLVRPFVSGSSGEIGVVTTVREMVLALSDDTR